MHIATRVLAILAVLALAFTLWAGSLLVGFTCFDSCPTREQYFPHQLSTAMFLLGPCIVLATLALFVFLAYCLATQQPRRALITLLYFIVVVLLGAVALNALVQYGQATVSVYDESSVLIEDSIVAWARQWTLSILLLGVVWSGGLACLEWSRRWKRLDQPAAP
jgi:hypothetical protein